jgi:RNA polymerase-binding transcription factor DksA
MRGVTTPLDRTETTRARLEELRAALREELGEEIEAPGQMTYGSQAAAAAHVFAQQRDLALRDQAERRYRAVDHALARLSAGTYTICETCKAVIPAERQELLPWATTCVACGSHLR